MVEILTLVLQHDEQAVLSAVELGVATKTHILDLLHRLTVGKPNSRLIWSAGAPLLQPHHILTKATDRLNCPGSQLQMDLMHP